MCGGCGLNGFEWLWWSFWVDSGRLGGDLRVRVDRAVLLEDRVEPDGGSRCTRSVAARGGASQALSRQGEGAAWCGLERFERSGSDACRCSEGAAWIARTHPHPLGMEVSQASRLVCVCVCVLGCGWAAYPHTSRGGRNVAAFRVPCSVVASTLRRKCVFLKYLLSCFHVTRRPTAKSLSIYLAIRKNATHQNRKRGRTVFRAGRGWYA